MLLILFEGELKKLKSLLVARLKAKRAKAESRKAGPSQKTVS